MRRQATSLKDLYEKLSYRPLLTPAELNAFYRPEVNQVRGMDQVERLAARLLAARREPFKGFIIGHPGVGKSTEIARLTGKVESQFRDRKSTRLNSSHIQKSRMPSSA